MPKTWGSPLIAISVGLLRTNLTILKGINQQTENYLTFFQLIFNIGGDGILDVSAEFLFKNNSNIVYLQYKYSTDLAKM